MAVERDRSVQKETHMTSGKLYKKHKKLITVAANRRWKETNKETDKKRQNTPAATKSDKNTAASNFLKCKGDTFGTSQEDRKKRDRDRKRHSNWLFKTDLIIHLMLQPPK